MKKLITILFCRGIVTPVLAFQPNRGSNTYTIIPRDQNYRHDLANDIPYEVRYPRPANAQTCYTEYRAVNPDDFRSVPDLLQGLARLVNPKRQTVYEPVYRCQYYLR